MTGSANLPGIVKAVADPSLPPCQELLAAYCSQLVGNRGAGQFLLSYWNRSGILVRAVTILSGMLRQNGKGRRQS